MGNNISLFGYQSTNPVDCAAYDLSIITEEKKHQEELKRKPQNKKTFFEEDAE